MEYNLAELFWLGGPFMWPLLVFSMITMAVALERLVFFAVHAKKLVLPVEGQPGAFFLPVFALVQEYAHLNDQQLERIVEERAFKVIAQLERGVSILPIMASLAPLTGFAGTVAGMISAFRSIAATTQINAQIVAGGIYEALITTLYGLVIAIVAIICHYALTARIDHLRGTLESRLNTQLSLRHGGIIQKENENS